MPHYSPVERRASMPLPELEKEWLREQRPVILTNLTANWSAHARWTPDFFRTHYGSCPVEVYDTEFQEPGRHYLRPTRSMSFASFLDAAEEGTPYRLFLFELFKMAPELRADIVLPSWMDWLSRQFLVSFFGGPGGVTTFHYDVDLPHVFHTVVYGEKEFTLFPPDQSAHLYRHPFTVRSYVDSRDPDLGRFPRFAEARGYRCTVRAGETLVIPSGQWHQTFYSGLSWGLAFRKYDPRLLLRASRNMLLQEPFDRSMTALAGEHWFQWKERRSGAELGASR